SMIEEGVTGWLFEPGDAAELARLVSDVFEDTDTLRQMRSSVRADFEAKYSIERNLDRLLEIYREAMEYRDARQRSRT
ncbi:MAG: glycosyltransferase, partial [Acidimicrobiia bacterium]